MERNDGMSLLEGAVAQDYDDWEHRWKVDGVIPPLNRHSSYGQVGKSWTGFEKIVIMEKIMSFLIIIFVIVVLQKSCY